MFEQLLENYEAYFYPVAYFGSLAVVGFWEVFSPRRKLSASVLTRWVSAAALTVINTLLFRFAAPLLTIPFAIWLAQREIGLFNTEIKTKDGLCLIVPNNIIWDSPITNFSRNPTRRFDITVGIGYGDDVDGAMDLLMGLLTGDERILDDPEPLVMIEDLGDNAVIINLRAWAWAEDFWAAVWDLKKAIKVELEAAGYSIPFPQRDIHIVSGDKPET